MKEGLKAIQEEQTKVLDFCSLPILTEVAMIRRVAGKPRNSYSTKQEGKNEKDFLEESSMLCSIIRKGAAN